MVAEVFQEIQFRDPRLVLIKPKTIMRHSSHTQCCVNIS